MKKRTVSVCLAAAMVLTACSGGTETAQTEAAAEQTTAAAAETEAEAAGEETEAGAEGGEAAWDFTGIKAEIDIDGTIIDKALNTFESMVAEFNELTGAELELVVNGDDHESIMKTRMASNDMPDMFTTHGWSTIRYNEFCYDLSGEPWVGDMVESAAAVVTDANGKVCTCPLTEWVYGIAYNETIMEENGIDMYAVQTWDDLFEVLTTLKANGITPISMGGKNGFGGYLEMCNVFYSADGAMYDGAEELMNGTFSFVDHPEIFQRFAEVYDNGWFIEDLFTADPDTARNYVAAGDAAMLLWGSPEWVDLMKTINDASDFAIIPTPAVEEGGNAAYTVGEGTAIAISKDTQNLELCQAFLQFMTDPENLKEYVDATGAVSGFSTITQDDTYSLNQYNESLEHFDNLVFTNFFDREYLPSGMWNYMSESLAMLFDCNVGEAQGQVGAVAEYMQQNYEDLYATAAE